MDIIILFIILHIHVHVCHLSNLWHTINIIKEENIWSSFAFLSDIYFNITYSPIDGLIAPPHPTPEFINLK